MDADRHEHEMGTHEAPLAQPIHARGLALKNFTSQWFLVPQGTGILAVVLHQQHYRFRGLGIIATCCWVLTIAMLAAMLLVYLAHAVRYPSHVRSRLQRNAMETACLASISIAFTTVIQMITLSLVSTWGQVWGLVAYGLWWVNLVMAIIACVGIIFVFARVEAAGVDHVPVAIRLPPIAILTAAAGGGVVCRYGQLDMALQIPVIIVSYLCVGTGIFLALMCDAAFLIRLFDQSWPKGNKIFSIMIACGPYGQSSFAMQILGSVAERAFATHATDSLFINASGGRILNVCSTLVALLLWGYGTFWWVFACIAICYDLTCNTNALLSWDQHLAAWSLVFPWGVYTNAAIEFGTILSSRAFDIWSTVLSVLLVVLWLFNIAASMTGILNGKVFGLQRGWRAMYVDEPIGKRS